MHTDIHGLWALYQCDYVLNRKSREELWEALSRMQMFGASEDECIEVIKGFLPTK
jgi:hypothetical protein